METRRLAFERPLAALMLALAASIAPAAHADSGSYLQRNLVSDGFVTAEQPPDANLVNAWGIALNPFGPAWVNDNETGVSELFDGNGVAIPLVVHVPPAKNATPPSNPTGIVFNGNANAFKVSSASAGPAAAAFIFATENGTISGWSPAVDRNNAILVIDNSASSAVYKGLAVSANGTGARLYATDFSNARVDVFDATFAPVSVPGAFQDPRIPAGFAPFGIQNIGGNIYVSYAKQNAEKHDDVAGPGNGFVDAFDPDGHLIARVIRRGALNSPWGLALAPAGFGRFANRLLVGNFGDGLIHAFDLTDGHFVGTLKAPGGTPLQIGGLWGLAFGNGVDAQPVNTLFFASGPDGEAHGLYGRIDVAPAQE